MTYLLHNNLRALTPQNRSRHREVARATFGRRAPRWPSPTSGENFPAVVDMVFGTALDVGWPQANSTNSHSPKPRKASIFIAEHPIRSITRRLDPFGRRCPVGLFLGRKRLAEGASAVAGLVSLN